jgi:peptide-methionine (R)-S-oxide reductase
MQPTMPISDDEWKKKLTPEQYRILREKGTETPFTGEYVHTKENGMYVCAACGAELFSSATKYDSGSGWPSFYEAAVKGNITTQTDESHGMRRVEAMCGKCGSHLGHIFDDGPQPTGQRFCINSLSLKLMKKDEGKSGQ